MININLRDSRPIYEQVKDGFRSLIISGALPVGEKMPSLRELAASLTINPNTIQRAYRELEAEGYIASIPGKGSFVCQPCDAIEARKAELMGQFCEIVNELKMLGTEAEEMIAVIEGGKTGEN